MEINWSKVFEWTAWVVDWMLRAFGIWEIIKKIRPKIYVLINSFFKKISKPFSKKRTESISKFEDELEERSEEVNWCLNDNSGCLGCKNAKVKLDEINKCKRDDSKCNLCKENLKEFYLTKCKRNQKWQLSSEKKEYEKWREKQKRIKASIKKDKLEYKRKNFRERLIFTLFFLFLSFLLKFKFGYSQLTSTILAFSGIMFCLFAWIFFTFLKFWWELPKANNYYFSKEHKVDCLKTNRNCYCKTWKRKVARLFLIQILILSILLLLLATFFYFLFKG